MSEKPPGPDDMMTLLVLCHSTEEVSQQTFPVVLQSLTDPIPWTETETETETEQSSCHLCIQSLVQLRHLCVTRRPRCAIIALFKSQSNTQQWVAADISSLQLTRLISFFGWHPLSSGRCWVMLQTFVSTGNTD